MYEEVCLLCGKPVDVDGRAYCSDECESLDATSRSDSATSSAYPSPYLHSMNGPGNLADVPALVPSALGRAFPGRSTFVHNKNRLSLSSSSASSIAWDAFTDDEEDVSNLALHSGEDDYGYYNPELLAADVGSSKSAGSAGHLSYARRPSSTNNRSTVPLLHRRTSSISSPSNADEGAARSFAPTFSSTEDEFSDIPSASLSSSSSMRSHGRRPRKSTEADRERDPETTITVKSKRNRASLPAYFSLLTSSASPTSVRSQRFPSSIQTLTAFSRSLQSSPPTPRVANPIIDPMIAYAQHTRSLAIAVEATPRGRGRRHVRSPSCTHRSPGRSPTRLAHHTHVDSLIRARLDSVEKVADWVSHSPVVQARGRTITRRNSSPPPKPRYEMLLADAEPDLDADGQLEHLREALARSLRVHPRGEGEHAAAPHMDCDDRRGRRRAEELDHVPMGVDRAAPGYGSGRSGLRARDRERSRVVR